MQSNYKEEQIKVIEILAKHEEEIGNLYRTFSNAFPAYKEFWLSISNEEKMHADWIRTLLTEVKEGAAYFNENRFKIEAVRTSLNYIANKKAETERSEIQPDKAFYISLDIENALLEKRYFEVFEGDSPTLKHTLQSLADSTKNHVARMQNKVNEVNRKQYSPTEENGDMEQNRQENKNILQKIMDFPSWVWGPISIILSFIFPTLFGSLFFDPFNGLLGGYSSILGYLVYLLPALGITKGLIEIRSSKAISGIIGIIISLIASGLLILFYVV
jgi:rubrerythrin